MAGEVQKASVDNLRHSDAVTVQVLVADILRLHIERIEISVVADLFALSEAELPTLVAADLAAWAGKATREVCDLPDGEIRRAFLTELAALPAASVPARFRAAAAAMAASSSAETLAVLDALAKGWEDIAPTPVVIPVKKGRVASKAAATKKVAAPRKVAVPKAPPVDVDPRRSAYVRSDVTGTLQHLERGIKESVLLAGIRARSPFKDMLEPEVKAELRKLERERKLKKTGERWMIR